MSDKTHLLSIVHKCGIVNAEFWMSEFEKLGIQSLDRLQQSGIVLSQLKQNEEFMVDKESLQKLLDKKFHDTTTVIQRDIVDFESFDKFLRQLFQTVTPESYESQISKAIYHLSSHYSGTYDEVLISILIHCFKSKSNPGDIITLKSLSLKDVDNLRILFSEQRNQFMKYAKLHCQQLQAYLFNLAVCMNQNPKELFQQIMKTMKGLKPPLQQELLKHVNEYYLGTCPIHKFKQIMKYLMTTAPQASEENLPTKNPDSLDHILKKQVYPCEIAFQEEEQPELLTSASILLEKMGLCNYYPKKLQLQDALCIRPETLSLSLGATNITDVKQLPKLILLKLMSYDSLCRSDLMSNSNHAAQSSQRSSSESEDDDYEVSDEEDSCPIGIHPVDALLALILCSDHFLCQDLFSRLAKCQLAVPFLLPDPFTKQLTLPLWALRSIIKDWKYTKEDNTTAQQTQQVTVYGMPIVSFIRLGGHQKRGASKSKILNEVINNSHFFHRDCPGGQYNLVLGEGLVDMCWYLPAGKPADVFPDAVTFLNLHGDARQHLLQCKFLSKISSICFVLLTEELQEIDSQTAEILHQFASSPGGITVLNDVDKKPKALKKEIAKAHVINLTTKNGSEIKAAIQHRITTKLNQVKEFQSIEQLCRNSHEEISIDEDTENYKEGLMRAEQIMSILTGCKAEFSMKVAMLPLQGKETWQAWAASDKELHRQTQRGSKTVTDYTESIECAKKKIRNKQLSHVENLTQVMQSFIESLLTLGGSFNRAVRNYFLQCLKLQLNDLSRKNVSGLQYQYQATRKALSLLDSQNESEAKKKLLTEELQELQESIINSSLGLEHLLRELGQVYEAATESGKFADNLALLPQVAAELLIDGYPLELMDGNAAHVPLQWVSAVVEKAVKMLDDPIVFVLSVVGLQSTGKSTMLNTVFGLQFNVSAGRCTRGAFMQLLPVDEELKRLTKCSYVLVVDTEGLRAPELDPEKTQKHDNELATFVIGLANMTLINIYGEVPGDMDDILQTSVHAFLRMSQIKYKPSPSCQFIHQNAGANISSEVGRAKFTQKLNKFTKDAAKEENCEELFKSFNDVIHFDDQTDVHCFPGLWKGDPPMAPVNYGYSHASQMLKKHFINIMCRRSETSFSGSFCLSSFEENLTNLWKSLLKENFVFSYKNTLEITAYSSLEAAYSKWDWKFQAAMLKWEQDAENEITAAAASDVDSKVEEKCTELKDYILVKLHEPLKSEMQEFFNGKQSEILVQWKAKFEQRLDDLATNLRVHAEEHCKKIGKSRKTFSQIDEQKERYKSNVTQKVQKLIECVRREQELFHKHLEERKLDPQELKKILERKLFTSNNLMIFKEQKLIDDNQVKRISVIIDRCEGQLSENDLKEILVGGILSAKQVKDVMKVARHTDQELEDQFDGIWKEILDSLPPEKISFDSVDEKVEATLIEFARAKRHEGELINMLQKKRLTSWGKHFDLFPEEGKHFTKVTSFFAGSFQKLARKVKGSTDPDQIEAIEMTERVFSAASMYIDAITKKSTDFNVAFAKKLLRIVDDKITEESVSVKQRFKFTIQYSLEMFSIICGHAIPKFKEMNQVFKERNNPRLYLEQNVRSTLLTQYKNQIQAEEGVAAILCVSFEELIEKRVRSSLGRTMVTKMKNSHHYFNSKGALKVKVLTGTSREFEDLMAYVRNSRSILQNRIRRYAEEFCNGIDCGRTRLQNAAREEASSLVKLIRNLVFEVNDTNIENWLSKFSENSALIKATGFSSKAKNLLKGYESVCVWNLENFRSKIKDGLDNLEKRLHSSLDRIKYYEISNEPLEHLDKIVGCSNQCPFCGEMCDRENNHYGDHTTHVHRPSCLAGWRWDNSKMMVIDFCQSLVCSELSFRNPKRNLELHPYKQYRTVYTDWNIPGNWSGDGSVFWKWFVKTNNLNLAREFGAKPADVRKFRDYSRADIVMDLNKVYHF